MFLAVSWLCSQTLAQVADTYAIGDRGPAGGIVFYVTDGGSHGLEAARADSVESKWGCTGIDISGAEGTDIGAGPPNTAAIMAGCTELGIAAKIASDYSLNGFDDWFLPSIGELNELYKQRVVVGGFANNYYWSSSEKVGNYLSWYQYFYNGYQNYANKAHPFSVRVVRAF